MREHPIDFAALIADMLLFPLLSRCFPGVNSAVIAATKPKKSGQLQRVEEDDGTRSRLEQREWRENPPRRRAAHQTAACHFNIRAVRARIAPSRPGDCKERLFRRFGRGFAEL
jgi:hypothetical protein